MYEKPQSGYNPINLFNAALPHRNVKGNEFKTTDGEFNFTILANPDYGLPYGIYPRLILDWITREVLSEQQPEFCLHDNFSNYLTEIGLNPDGQRCENISGLISQLESLLFCKLLCRIKSKYYNHIIQICIASEVSTTIPNDKDACECRVILLDTDFFGGIINNPDINDL